MIFAKICVSLSLIVLASVVLIYAETNGNVINQLNGQMNGNFNGNLNNNLNNLEEESLAECTRCSEPRLIAYHWWNCETVPRRWGPRTMQLFQVWIFSLISWPSNARSPNS